MGYVCVFGIKGDLKGPLKNTTVSFIELSGFIMFIFGLTNICCNIISFCVLCNGSQFNNFLPVQRQFLTVSPI